VSVAVDAAKYVVTSRAVDSVRIAALSIVRFVLVVLVVAAIDVTRRNELIASCARNLRGILQHSLESMKFGQVVVVSSIVHRQAFLGEFDWQDRGARFASAIAGEFRAPNRQLANRKSVGAVIPEASTAKTVLTTRDFHPFSRVKTPLMTLIVAAAVTTTRSIGFHWIFGIEATA
jgi:hypothetical protein